MMEDKKTVFECGLDAVLVEEKVLNGDSRAKNEIITKLSSVIFSCVRGMSTKGQVSLNEEFDLVQEVWVRLLSDNGKILKKYDAERGMRPESYIAMIAKREVGHLLQKEHAIKRGCHLTIDFEDDLYLLQMRKRPERDFEARDMAVKLNCWLCSVLPCAGIDILRTTFYDEANPIDAAKHLDVTVQSVYNWRHKIRSLSRRFLNGDIGWLKSKSP